MKARGNAIAAVLKSVFASFAMLLGATPLLASHAEESPLLLAALPPSIGMDAGGSYRIIDSVVGLTVPKALIGEPGPSGGGFGISGPVSVAGDASSSDVGSPSTNVGPDRSLTSASIGQKKQTGGGSLSAWVMKLAWRISAMIHRTGGYRFDGYNDCYGFVKRTWNPILAWLHRHKINGNYPTVLPVGDFPSSAWHPIRNWDELIVGDVLGTVQGHRGGADVDYGMYGGKKDGVQYQFSNGGGAGPKFKPQTGRYRYYYGPTHELLRHLRK